MQKPGVDTLIIGGTLVTGTSRYAGDILIQNGKIAAIGRNFSPDSDTEIIDASGCIVTAGLADVHVHFREPGFSAKETIATGSAAAAHGGYTVVCAMPNLNPAPDSPETIAIEQAIIDESALIDVRPYATLTMGRKGSTAVDFKALKESAVAFSDDGSGVQDDSAMLSVMEAAAAEDCLVAAHCEDNSLLHGGYIHDGEYAHAHSHRGICSESEWGPIARDVELSLKSGCRYHVCHVSTAESVEVIRNAQKRGVKVTCETAPHYLLLSDADLREEGRFKMNPPLRGESDRLAIIRGIKDGTISMIATDHAPHTAEEKSRGLEHSAMGVVGLETAFAVVYTGLVREGIITLEEQIALMCDRPREVFRLGGGLEVGESADIAIFDLETPYTIDSSTFLSKGHATPFDGWQVYGRCVRTIYRGLTVWNAADKKI